jgi:filamentous hemagglutinin family protein
MSSPIIDKADKSAVAGKNKIFLVFFSFFTAILPPLTLIDFARSQIVPDKTLPINTQVTIKDNSLIIDGGSSSGANLYHSFEQFSILAGQTAFFNNSASIKNIIGRVTGSNVSNIDGLIKANDNANLFLINPNGIIFGKNATLDIGGSFLASTASNINFADGSTFSAINPKPDQILSVQIPIGLNINKNSGQLVINGDGHDLVGPGLSPVIGAGQSNNGLRVNPGNTLALVGGDILLNGGVLSSPGGEISIGSVNGGEVGLTSTSNGLRLGYSKVSNFKDIFLSNKALIDTSGNGYGSIDLNGKNISLADGSVIFNQNQGERQSDPINIHASNSLTISGTDPIARITGEIATETVGSAGAGNINIDSPRIGITTGGQITSGTYTPATSGDININSSESVNVFGASPLDPRALSQISTLGFLSSGKVGNINLTTGDLVIKDGGTVVSIATGSGAGGDVNIDAFRSVQLSGADPRSYTPAIIASSTFGDGNAGEVKITTSQLALLNSGRIDSSTLGSGSGGKIKIDADSINIEGQYQNDPAPSTISSTANRFDVPFQSLFGLPASQTGPSGDVTINVKNLRIINFGQLSVSNDGPSNAGLLKINANQILVSNGNIIASTNGGNGGDIDLSTSSLVLQNGNVSASAKGAGNGGNINIDSTLLAGDSRSFISANAEQGLGGNINIKTQGLIFRPQNITATSERGAQFNGNVNVNFATTTFTGKNELARKLSLAAAPISCSNGKKELRVLTADALNVPDDRLEAFAKANGIPMFVDAKGRKIPLLEVQGWISNGDGTARTYSVVDVPATSAAIDSGCSSANAKS